MQTLGTAEPEMTGSEHKQVSMLYWYQWCRTLIGSFFINATSHELDAVVSDTNVKVTLQFC